MLERNSINWELLASSNDTEFIINQSIKGINNPDEIFIVNHFLKTYKHFFSKPYKIQVPIFLKNKQHKPNEIRQFKLVKMYLIRGGYFSTTQYLIRNNTLHVSFFNSKTQYILRINIYIYKGNTLCQKHKTNQTKFVFKNPF